MAGAVKSENECFYDVGMKECKGCLQMRKKEMCSAYDYERRRAKKNLDYAAKARDDRSNILDALEHKSPTKYAVYCPEGGRCKFGTRRMGTFTSRDAAINKLVNHLTASSAHEMRAAKANEFAKSDYWITAEENDDDRSRSPRPSVKLQTVEVMSTNDILDALKHKSRTDLSVVANKTIDLLLAT